jgi:multiple sugar transport system permease protein
MMSSLTERVIKLTVLRAIALYTTLIVMAWFALFPILWALSGSLKKEPEVTEPVLFPRHPAKCLR